MPVRTALARWAPPPMLAMFAPLPPAAGRPAWFGGYTYLGTEVMILAIFALGYNLLLGYTGLPAFGHGAFFGIGGYSSRDVPEVGHRRALPPARRRRRRAPPPAAPSSRSSSPAGAASTSPCSRSPSASCSGSWSSSSTRGPAARTGSPGINRLAVLGYALRDNVPFYYFVYALFVGATVVLWRIVNSPFGQVIRAIRAERDARPRRRLRRGPVQVGGVHALVRVCGPGRRALRARAVRRLRRADEPVAVGQRRAHVPDRRRVRELLRAGPRRRRLPGAARRASRP